MVDEKAMKRGWEFMSQTIEINSALFSNLQNTRNVSNAKNQFDELVKNLVKRKSNQTDASLAGFIAEEWHSGTFNVNAALHGSANRAHVEASNKHASVDVSTNFGENYSMKYYKTPKDSAKNQATNVIQDYHKYLNKNKNDDPMSFEEYTQKNGYSSEGSEIYSSVYKGQGRVIPADQLEKAIKYLEDAIKKESSKNGPNRPEVLKNYQETLAKLTDRIKDNNGNESIPLTKEEAEALGRLIKEGKCTAKDLGLKFSDYVDSKYIFKKACLAGLNAAVISSIMQTAPDIFKSISYLIKYHELDIEQIKRTGEKALKSSAEGFLIGSLTCALQLKIASGVFGPAIQKAICGTTGTTILGALVSLTWSTVKNSVLVASGKMSAREMGAALIDTVAMSSSFVAGAYIGGIIGQAIGFAVPVVGYLLGSLIGSAFSVVYNIGKNKFLSFCVDSGFTCFGLVDQDYTLPEELLKDMGIDITPITRTQISRTEISRTIVGSNINRTTLDTIDLKIVKRGIIGVNKVGYVL